MDKTTIEISTSTIIKVILAILLIAFLFFIRQIIAILFFAFILFLIMKPAVDFLKSKKLPSTLAVLIIYVVFLAVFLTVLILIIPPIFSETKHLAQNFPAYWDGFTNKYSEIKGLLDRYAIGEETKEFINNFATSDISFGGVFTKVGNFFESFISFMVVLVITFYLLVDQDALKRVNRSMVPAKYQPYLNQLFTKVQTKLGWWVRGQLILSASIFLCVYIALLILGVKYALILAIIAGLLEFIPYIGPILSGIFGVMLSLFQSPLLALMVLGVYIVIQWLENHILVPKVMQKTIGLNPVISIVALLIGAKIGGVVGVILAIPVAAAISVFISDVYEFETNKNEI